MNVSDIKNTAPAAEGHITERPTMSKPSPFREFHAKITKHVTIGVDERGVRTSEEQTLFEVRAQHPAELPEASAAYLAALKEFGPEKIWNGRQSKYVPNVANRSYFAETRREPDTMTGKLDGFVEKRLPVKDRDKLGQRVRLTSSIYAINGMGHQLREMVPFNAVGSIVDKAWGHAPGTWLLYFQERGALGYAHESTMDFL